MEAATHVRNNRIRGGAIGDAGLGVGRPRSRNKQWTSEPGSRSGTTTPGHIDGERWERGGHRGGGRGARGLGRGLRKFPNVSLRVQPATRNEERAPAHDEVHSQHEVDEPFEEEYHEINEPELETAEEREKFYQELVKGRETERKKAIAEGKMDDPLVPKRLEDAISIVGTCLDMCPRFERYRRERENNLFEWETIPGTKRIDHQRAVKMYERAAGDKTLPSDLRPPHVLKRTLDYLFHDLLPRAGFSQTFNFIRDRSRAVRNDFTMQHITGRLAIECHDRCARFHILALHLERDRPGFSIPLEEQQLMNTLQSLKEFYEDQRGRFESPAELEMRVYHRLIHIRDQRERHEDVPEHITSHPVFKLTTEFRLHVQRKSAPISKVSPLVVDEKGMEIFGQLASVLREQGSLVMIYLVACILERLFGKETIEDIEAIRGSLSIPDLIDGISTSASEQHDVYDHEDEDMDDQLEDDEHTHDEQDLEYEDKQPASTLFAPSSMSAFGASPFASSSVNPSTNGIPSTSAFSSITSTPSVFGTTFTPATTSVFGSNQQGPPKSVFGQSQIPQAPQPSAFSTGNVAPAIKVNESSGPKLFPPSTPSTASKTPSIFGASTTSNMDSFLSSRANTTAADTSGPSFGAVQNPFSQPFNSGGNPGFGTTFSQTFKLSPHAPSFTPPPILRPEAPPITNGISMPPRPSKDTSPSTSASQQPPINMNFDSIAPIITPSASPPVQSQSNTRTSATPPLLKIDTNPFAKKLTSSPSVNSPLFPPPLSRPLPISLPSTPTTAPPNPLLGHLKSTLGSFTSSPGQPEILSPLLLPSPSTSSPSSVADLNMKNFSPSGTPKHKRLRTEPSLLSLSMGINGKGKVPLSKQLSASDTVLDLGDSVVQALEGRALEFERKSGMVKGCFEAWKKKTMDKAAWADAVGRGEVYGRKVRSERERMALSGSLGKAREGQLEKKRRISFDPSVSTLDGEGKGSGSPLKKRIRRRVSSEYKPPRSDEELAKQLKENHEEHERRWAAGSFLQVLRSHIKSRPKNNTINGHNSMKINKSQSSLQATTSSSSGLGIWDVWLSMNPESDATAIWLERKFGVPDLGKWVSETVFAIHLEPDRSLEAEGYPGVIIFECTPLDDVEDVIEKKYRVLDDCARLRDIIKGLPLRRHYTPSLLVLSWSKGELRACAPDLDEMVQGLIKDQTLLSYHALPLTSNANNVDGKFEEALKSLDLDVEGRLVEALSVRGVFKLYEVMFISFVVEWLDNCITNGYFDWRLYAQLVQACVALLDNMVQHASKLLDLGDAPNPMTLFDPSQVDDSLTMYEAALDWLETTGVKSAERVAMDLKSHLNIGQEFPARAFVDHTFELYFSRIEEKSTMSMSMNREPGQIKFVMVSDIQSSSAEFKTSIRPWQTKLGQALAMSLRRSPKRRSCSVATTEGPSPRFKRARLSTSSATSMLDENDRERTPPSSPMLNDRGESADAESVRTENAAPSVTIAMLRALTRDVKRKYGT